MDDLVHHQVYQGRTLTHTWVGAAAVVPSRVHALAFTADGRIVLVGGAPGESGWWLPGGGIEAGEAPEDALRRELWEEAAATLEAVRPLGCQRVDDSARGSTFHALYWARVTLAEAYLPQHEVSQRHLVRPQQFRAALSWGHTAMAAHLLDQALTIDRALGAPRPPPP